MGRVGPVFAVCLLVAAAASGWEREKCKALKGAVMTVQTTVGCTSPVGLCFTGVLKTNSRLRGTTYFVVTSAEAVPGTSLIAFTGVYTVTEPNGTVVTFQSSGLADLAAETFSETFAGTLDGETVLLTATGTTNATLSAFTGAVTGTICREGGFSWRAGNLQSSPASGQRGPS